MLYRISYFLSVFGLYAAIAACSHMSALGVSDSGHRAITAQCASLLWERVAPSVWVLYGHESNSTSANEGRVSNIVFARENTGVTNATERGWLIGSGPSQRMGQLLRCSLEHQLGITVTDVVSARAHPESVLGASAFAKASHWALPQVALAMQQRCPQCSQQLAATIVEKSIADQTISIPMQYLTASSVTDSINSKAATIGPFDVWSVHLDKQEWGTVFRHKDSGVWFAPGLIWGTKLVPDVRDADVYRLTEALEVLAKHKYNLVIPEQGRVAGFEIVQSNVNYWALLEAQTKLAIRQGAADVNSFRSNSVTGFEVYRQPNDAAKDTLNRDRHSINQQRVWRQLEQSYFDATSP
jgi:hypothetical protein